MSNVNLLTQRPAAAPGMLLGLAGRAQHYPSLEPMNAGETKTRELQNCQCLGCWMETNKMAAVCIPRELGWPQRKPHHPEVMSTLKRVAGLGGEKDHSESPSGLRVLKRLLLCQIPYNHK